MKTRLYYVFGGFSFQYTEAKRPTVHDWHCVGGTPAIWPTAAERDRARACFTNRRTVQAAIADLRREGLYSTPTTGGTE